MKTEPYLHAVNICKNAHAAEFAAARRCLRFLVNKCYLQIRIQHNKESNIIHSKIQLLQYQ